MIYTILYFYQLLFKTDPNLKYVKLVARDKVTLTTGEEVYMSLRKYKGFKTSFVRYISQL